MFESVITSQTAYTGAPGSLRAIEWTEIVARLSAARDVRALFARPSVAGGAFVPHAVAGIAFTPPGQRSVNLAALATGKWVHPTTAAAARASGDGERDN